MTVCQYSIFQRSLQFHLDRLLSAGEAFPLSVCYSADPPCCVVSSILHAPLHPPYLRPLPEVTLHSTWRRRFTLRRLPASASTSYLSSSSASPVSPHPIGEPRKHTTVMRANSENTATLAWPRLILHHATNAGLQPREPCYDRTVTYRMENGLTTSIGIRRKGRQRG